MLPLDGADYKTTYCILNAELTTATDLYKS
jgi:hypothetical protein